MRIIDGIIVGRLGDMQKAWCVAEYSVSDGSGNPPVVMMINACRLADAYAATDNSRNSVWRDQVTANHTIMVRLLWVGDKLSCLHHLSHAVHAMTVKPICNMRGHSNFGRAREILCSNGESYRTQTEAAQALGVNQGAISRCLSGSLNAVNGFTFTWKD